jgi:broad specificity phosphatase PhoE
MASRVERPLTKLLDEFPDHGGICVSHGDPIQAFWINAEHRGAYALHRLQVAKGGRLELDYEDHTLSRLAYCRPSTAGAPEAASARPGSSHA